MTYPGENEEQRMLRILNHEATQEEIRDFAEWLNIPEHEEYFRQWKKIWNLTSGPEVTDERVEQELLRFRAYIRAAQQRQKPVRVRTLRRIAVWAAVLVLPLTLAVYLLLQNGSHKASLGTETVAEIFPGESRAVLTTADGREVALGTGESSRVEVGQNAFVQDDGTVVVYVDSAYRSDQIEYNSLTVPRGGEYRIVLSDGTEVYMNSASELKYPVAFGKDERAVYLTGEAYFQVKKDEQRPFCVYVNAVKIQVYGTSFHVSTHHAESIRTVLVEGSVGIRGNGPEYRLKPSQLAEYTKDGELKQIREVDVRPYIAWREGLFLFEDEGLEEIMNTLSLWYDVDVFYTSEAVKDYHFTGYMQRYEQIDRILNAISKMVGVNFKINGKTIIVGK